MYKKINYLFILILTTASLYACDVAVDERGCPITIDSTSILDKSSFQGKNYVLILRISGWHEKTEILELYNEEPHFDKCGESNITPIIADSLESDITDFSIDLKNKIFNIEYAKDTDFHLSSSELKITFLD